MAVDPRTRDPRQPHRTSAEGRERPRTWPAAIWAFVKEFIRSLVTGG